MTASRRRTPSARQLRPCRRSPARPSVFLTNDSLPGLGVEVAAWLCCDVLAKEDQFDRVTFNPALAVNVMRRVEPGHKEPRAELLLIQEAYVAIGVQPPVPVAVPPADYASDAPRLVVVPGGLCLRAETGPPQCQAVSFTCEDCEGGFAAV